MFYKRLGEMLVSSGVITEEQLNKAIELQSVNPVMRIDEILVAEGAVTHESIHEALEYQLGIKFMDLGSVYVPSEMAQVIPQSIAKKYNLVPVSADDATVEIAMADPLNFQAVDAVRLTVKKKVVAYLATPDNIERVIGELYGSVSAEKALQDMGNDDDGAAADINGITANVIGAESEDAAPTIRLVNSFLEYAVSQNASDIHFEPRETAMYVRLRIDGVLRHVFTIPRSTQNAVVARIKVMGNMNIAEHKIPLDGRSNVRIADKDVDLRISTLPTVYGEKVVIRLLHKSKDLLSTSGIGLSGNNLAKFNKLLDNNNGVILIVGPTGSGKSSSMYTMIDKLNTEQVNLVTLEDPVEYNFDGVNQVQINEKTGMTFASGLRSILRQDPDIIAVGEIRDGETADIAMRAAITGHLVLSTLHTNDAPSTIERLVDMGVENFLIASALKGVISQRLVRKICPHCKEEYVATAEEQRKLRLPVVEGRTFFRGKGCPRCFNTGYRGRTAVFEILVITPDVRNAISSKLSNAQLMEVINQSGFSSMLKDCIRLVKSGVTTVDEAYRTVNSTNS